VLWLEASLHQARPCKQPAGFGGDAQPAARAKRETVPRWQHEIEAIFKLPKARQRFVSEVLDTVLAQH
jgi:hypothetical protein